MSMITICHKMISMSFLKFLSDSFSKINLLFFTRTYEIDIIINEVMNRGKT